MNNDFQIFEFEGRDKVRSILKGDEPWFVAQDVGEALGYSNISGAVQRSVDKEDRDGIRITDTIGREQQMTIINESGLYALIFSCTLPQGKRFKRWVTSEVLPSIRKYGSYSLGQVPFYVSPTPYPWARKFGPRFHSLVSQFEGRNIPNSLVYPELVYYRLPEGVYEGLQTSDPMVINPNGRSRRKYALHQYIITGNPMEIFEQTILQVETTMDAVLRFSRLWRLLIETWDAIRPKHTLNLNIHKTVELNNGQLYLFSMETTVSCKPVDIPNALVLDMRKVR